MTALLISICMVAAGTRGAYGDEIQFKTVADAGIGGNDDFDISPNGELVLYFQCERKNCTDRSLIVVTTSGAVVAVDRSKEANRWKSPYFVGNDAIVVFEPGWLNHAEGHAVVLKITPGGGLVRTAKGAVPLVNDFHSQMRGEQVVIAAADPGNQRIAVVDLDGTVLRALNEFKFGYAQWIRLAPNALWFRAFVRRSDEAFLDTYDGPATIISKVPVVISDGGFVVRGFVLFGDDALTRQHALQELLHHLGRLPSDFQRPAPGESTKSWYEIWDTSTEGAVLMTTLLGMYVIDADRITASLVLATSDYDRAGVAMRNVRSLAISDGGRIAMLSQEGGRLGRRSVSVIAK